jgi:hypothetical protein
MERVLGPQMGDFVRTLHEEHGAIFHLEERSLDAAGFFRVRINTQNLTLLLSSRSAAGCCRQACRNTVVLLQIGVVAYRLDPLLQPACACVAPNRRP